MKRIISLLILAFLVDASSLYAQHRVTLEDMMEQVKQMYPVSFVYDASIRGLFYDICILYLFDFQHGFY